MADKSKGYSRLTQQATLLLGQQIELARKNRRMSETELARRIGVSRSTVQRLEQGITGVEIGTYFEAATILGVPLFEAGATTLAPQIEQVRSMLTLMPKRVRSSNREVKDDF